MSNNPIYAANWPGDPSGFPGCGVWDNTNPWFNAIIANTKLAGGPACDVNPDQSVFMADGQPGNPNQWLANTRQSALEARNQVVKFAKRRDFLLGRVREVKNILRVLDGEIPCRPDTPGEHICERAGDDPKNCSDEEPVTYSDEIACAGLLPCPDATLCPSGCGSGVLETFRTATRTAGAIDKLVDFLCGPAAELIRARIELMVGPDDSGLPFQAIYGWRDESDDDAELEAGKWHIVKVEMRIPGRCDTACGKSQTMGSDPNWPTISKEMRNWVQQCYYLRNTEGVVKARVTRWDEDKSASDPIAFPNGVPLWQFRSNNIERPLDPLLHPTEHNPDMLESVCSPDALLDPTANSALRVLGDSGLSDRVRANYRGAFIMNRRITSSDRSTDPTLGRENESCWNLANGLLSTGVVKETCGAYFWHGGYKAWYEDGTSLGDDEGYFRGMGVKFVPCRPF
jgi:hypothetical protein